MRERGVAAARMAALGRARTNTARPKIWLSGTERIATRPRTNQATPCPTRPKTKWPVPGTSSDTTNAITRRPRSRWAPGSDLTRRLVRRSSQASPVGDGPAGDQGRHGHARPPGQLRLPEGDRALATGAHQAVAVDPEDRAG